MNEVPVEPALDYICLLLGFVLWGVAFLLIWKFPDLYERLNVLMRVIIATGSAFVAAFIPGAIGIDLGWVKASGALAVFLLVYWVDPGGKALAGRHRAAQDVGG